MSGYHVPVLCSEVIDYLQPGGDKIIVDATLGGGGHSEAIARQMLSQTSIVQGRLIGLDQDPQAIEESQSRLGSFPFFTAVRANFASLGEALDALEIPFVDGILMDLGVSSHQLDTAERGFSFRFDGDLDMRMDLDSPLRAADIIANQSEEELYTIIRDYGEERFARRIARHLVEERQRQPIVTTKQLAEIVNKAIPRCGKLPKINPATRTFQALRIAVNDELGVLEKGLQCAIEHLAKGGRLVVISYHSLEDRLVKTVMRSKLGRCTCPPRTPVCVCQAVASLRLVHTKALVPSEQEQSDNPRARSAKMRVAEKL